MKALVGAFNQEKALVGAFSVIEQPVVEPMEHYTALLQTKLADINIFLIQNIGMGVRTGTGGGTKYIQ